MDKPIKTFGDLIKEKENLKHQIAIQKGNIQYDIAGMKNAVKPATVAYNLFGKYVNAKPNSPALVMVTRMITAFILVKIIKKRKGGIIRKIAALLLANFITLSVRPLVVAVNNFLMSKFRPPVAKVTPTVVTVEQPY